ncbi:MAG: hypothetical protein WCP19_13150 [Chloroflexota bacterium]
MKAVVGLWIDHKKAVIVTGDGSQLLTLNSNLEKRVRFAGGDRGKTAYSANYFPADDQIDRRYNEHLNRFYSEVITHLKEAEAIIIFGPGEAKIELQKKLALEGFEKSILGVETSDKLTDNQISARVKQFVAEHAEAVR